MERIQTGTLPHGFEFKKQMQKAFEMREVATAGELFDAEVEAGGVENQLAFNGALIARQLVRIGDCEGPFSLEQIRKMKPADYQALRVAQGKLNSVPAEDENEASQSGSK
ncbi:MULTISPECIES: phage tail assembly protein [unclassified Neptuniibacter]|uniref:phage tail assembly protein n=1 Tax=unclassified Neptuniibacter TaxID=2630693 RepID=UPI0025D82279|nr:MULTISPECIES: phage tail assembly protein [unclassified Neptuniibacter]